MDAYRGGPDVADSPAVQYDGRDNNRSLAAYPFIGCDSWWEAEPPVGRLADGVPLRSHQLRALGNAIVPECAAWIAQRIVLYEAQTGWRDQWEWRRT
jgi:hypothetical protein